MSLHPDVQKSAQAELDLVVGRNCMPEAEDRERLPYVNAVVKETLRWHTAVRSIANETTSDSVSRAIMHNEKVYPDPERFSPERYLKDESLDPEVMDPASVVFGMGRRSVGIFLYAIRRAHTPRRICPGRYFADATMVVLIASVLHSFGISPGLDDRGRPVLSPPRPTTGDIS